MSTIFSSITPAWLTDGVRRVLADMCCPPRTERILSPVLEHGSLAAHNEAFLASFFTEQFTGPRNGGDILRRIIDRDFGGRQALHEAWLRAVSDDTAAWLILALSFQDFRFHLFPLAGHQAPFCVAPILSWCAHPAVVEQANMLRVELLDRQWRDTNWNCAEQRLACLSQPLDLFSEPQNCVAIACEPRDVARGA